MPQKRTQPSSTHNDMLVQNCPSDSISSITFSPNANILVAGSWDKKVSCWEVDNNGNANPKAQLDHDGPVLCVAMNSNETIFSGGCDNVVKMWDVQSGQSQVCAQHDAPVKEIAYLENVNMLVTASWDKTLKYWDCRSNQPQGSVNLPERAYCMGVNEPLIVVGTAERKIQIYDVRNPGQVFNELDSPLKMQSRCVAAFPDRGCYALGSVEGRVAINYVEQKDEGHNFAFKCHRHQDNVYAINDIAIHPFGTFATVGSDGSYRFWDKDARVRLKHYERGNQPITSCCFNKDGTIFAYALSYDWSMGVENYDTNSPPQIYLHQMHEAECQPKNKNR